MEYLYTKNELKYLVIQLQCIAAKWWELGLLLGLDIGKLEIIRHNHPQDAVRSLMEVLNIWLNSDNEATNKKLAQCLSCQVIGEMELAQRLYPNATKKKDLIQKGQHQNSHLFPYFFPILIGSIFFICVSCKQDGFGFWSFPKVFSNNQVMDTSSSCNVQNKHYIHIMAQIMSFYMNVQEAEKFHQDKCDEIMAKVENPDATAFIFRFMNCDRNIMMRYILDPTAIFVETEDSVVTIFFFGTLYYTSITFVKKEEDIVDTIFVKYLEMSWKNSYFNNSKLELCCIMPGCSQDNVSVFSQSGFVTNFSKNNYNYVLINSPVPDTKNIFVNDANFLLMKSFGGHLWDRNIVRWPSFMKLMN